MNKNSKIYLLYASSILLGALTIYAVSKFLSKKLKAVRLAKNEWIKWGEQTLVNNNIYKRGGQENELGFAKRVGDYWQESMGLPYDGYNTDIAWSAAFISWIMKKAGYSNFPFSQSHSTYIEKAVKNRKQGNTNADFVAYKSYEVEPEVGDLVCYSRENQTDLYDRTGGYKSHCDIVINKDKNKIEVIGGNVSQSVSKKFVSLNSQGKINDTNNKWFAVIKNNS